MSKKVSVYKKMEMEKRRKTLRTTKPKNQDKGKRPRKRYWSEDDWDEIDYSEKERVMPLSVSEDRRKREQAFLDRQKQMGLKDADNQKAPQAPISDGIEGRVIGVFTQHCDVQVGEEVWRCALRGSLRGQQNGFSNPLAVGDRVQLSQVGEQEGVVEEVLPRQNVLARKQGVGRQAVAANVDRVLIVQAWRQPDFWPELVDRYWITAQVNGLDAVLCVNKVDLVKDKAEFETILKIYRQAGLQVLETSAKQNKGISELKNLVANSTTVLAGLSGVGKSSLISAVQPGLDLDALNVGERGKNKNQGRHTTTSSTLYQLDNGGLVIDTPGIREFGLAGLGRGELAGYYPEILQAAQTCGYANCSHIHEPGCGVLAGLQKGKIAQMRYDNYLKIYQSLPDV